MLSGEFVRPKPHKWAETDSFLLGHFAREAPKIVGFEKGNFAVYETDAEFSV